MSEHYPIDQRQLDGESLRLLRAYIAEYRRAKHYRGIRFTVSGMIAVAGPVVSLWSLTGAGVVGAAAGAWALVARVLLVPAERRRCGYAVGIQERFDTRLFDLPWPDALAGTEPSDEDIADAARRVRNDERLTRLHEEGWYPSTEGLPWPVDVLVAQWSSAAFGRRQHRDYFWFISASAGAVVIASIVFGLVIELSLTDWVITFLLPALPALLDISDLADSHRRLADAKQALETKIGDLWRRELANPGMLTCQDCRKVQDEAFKLRAEGRHVPDWYYWVHRDQNETNMRDAAATRRTRYEDAIGSP